jgi:hypothetical protein
MLLLVSFRISTGRLVFRLAKEGSNEALDLIVLNTAAEYQLRVPYAKLEAERDRVKGTVPKPEEASSEKRSDGTSRRQRSRSFWGPGGLASGL